MTVILKKRRRGEKLVGTWYAVRALDRTWDLWWPAIHQRTGALSSGFPGAKLFNTREAAAKAGKKIARGFEIVDVRCRALSTKTKASKKRAR